MQTVTVQERIDGYIEALKDKGALINPAHMITDFKPLSVLKDAEAHPLYRYISNKMVTAYISLNGRLGVQIYQMAKQAGLRIPEDVSIVSFDDPTSIVEEFSIFTHVKQFEREMESVQPTSFSMSFGIAARLRASAKFCLNLNLSFVKPLEAVPNHHFNA